MCGIAGYWCINNASPDSIAHILHQMSGALSHRGPDSSGIWVDPQIPFGLAHQRLAVIDLSESGSQPMISPSQRFCISFNGEIYNHKELRDDLDSNWRGSSDTETLLVAIEKWGLYETLTRISGMFAFALWDRSNRTLRLVRDRFGEKPLYWGFINHQNSDSLVFSSELSAIRAIPGLVTPAISQSALASYFTSGYVSAPHSIYENIYQLLPGSLITFGSPSASPSSTQWWDLISEATNSSSHISPHSKPSDFIDELQSILITVISQYSSSDVPLGTFLSGGVDSSLITALLQANSAQAIKTFTISFPDFGSGESYFDESSHASDVSSYLGTSHTEIALSPSDAFTLIPNLPSIYSEPFSDSSQVPTHLVCREARRSGLTVALSGDGGDELFGGYNRHRLAPHLHRYLSLLPSLIRSSIAFGIDQIPISDVGLSIDKRNKLSSALRSCGSPHLLYGALTNLRHDFNSLFTKDFITTIAPYDISTKSFFTSFSYAEQLMLADSISYLPNDILVKVDRAAMAASLETRAPFLDFRLAKFAWSLPVHMKLCNGVGKWALRLLLERYLPSRLFNRPKAGFAMPLGPWLRGPLRSWADDLLDPSLINRHGLLNSTSVQNLWNSHLSGSDQSSKLWSLLMWQAWLLEWG